MENFPKLKDAGGYELLRVGARNRCLEVIPIPPGGYTVEYLKDVVQQAKVYIRPTVLQSKRVDFEYGVFSAVFSGQTCMSRVII